MRKLHLYTAMSLNGKIASPDGEVEWLDAVPHEKGEDYGYTEFYDSIDTTIMGNETYRKLLSWNVPFPYSGKTNYVLTRDSSLEDNQDVKYISSDLVEWMKALKQESGKGIWLIGGGQVNRLFWNAGLVDEVRVSVMPYVLDEGIELFEGLPDRSLLKLVDSKTYVSGVVQLKYEVLYRKA